MKQAEQSGYVNYYVREGKKAAAGSRIYSLDETGELEHYLEESQEAGQAFTDENLALLKKKLRLSACLMTIRSFLLSTTKNTPWMRRLWSW